MKKLLALALVLATPAFAQLPPTTPPPATTAKPQPLGSGDKKFIKDTLEGVFFVLNLTGQTKINAKLDATKTESDALKTDLDKVWADVAGVAGTSNEKIPTALTGADKMKAEHLGKTGDKFDKEFLKLANHEMDKLAKSFETAAKGQMDPALKKIATDWEPTLKGHVAKLTAAEKEAAKTK